MVSLKVHNVLDYVLGAVLIVCPFVFGFSGIDAGRDLFLVLGIGLIGYSLCTDYTYSLFKWIPVGWHMAFDAIAGVLLILGSYIFGYNDLLTAGQTVLHYVLGIGAIALVAATRTKPEDRMSISDSQPPAPPIDINRRSA
jgi:hypothetical protein